MNPVDYKIWAVMQELVYEKRVNDVDELCQRLLSVAQHWTKRHTRSDRSVAGATHRVILNTWCKIDSNWMLVLWLDILSQFWIELWLCCIPTHLTFQVSQGSAATDLWWGENFNTFLFSNSLLYIAVKKLRKSVNICLSYWKINVSRFYGPRCI